MRVDVEVSRYEALEVRCRCVLEVSEVFEVLEVSEVFEVSEVLDVMRSNATLYAGGWALFARGVGGVGGRRPGSPGGDALCAFWRVLRVGAVCSMCWR